MAERREPDYHERVAPARPRKSNWTASGFFRVPEVSAHLKRPFLRARRPSGHGQLLYNRRLAAIRASTFSANLGLCNLTLRPTKNASRHTSIDRELDVHYLTTARGSLDAPLRNPACDELTQDTSGRTPQAFSLCSCWPSSRSSSPPPARSCAVPPCCRAVSVARTGTRASDAPRFLPGLKVRGRGSQGRAKSIRWSPGALKRERCPSRRG